MHNIYITIYLRVVIILSLRNTERNLSKKDSEYVESPVHYSDVYCSWIESGGYYINQPSESLEIGSKTKIILKKRSFKRFRSKNKTMLA